MKFYRFETGKQVIDEAFFITHPKAKLITRTFTLLRETPCGYWVIEDCKGKLSNYFIEKYKRWVSKSSRKRYCYPTIEEAWESYEIRRSKRVWYLERDLGIAKSAMMLTIDMVKEIGARS